MDALAAACLNHASKLLETQGEGLHRYLVKHPGSTWAVHRHMSPSHDVVVSKYQSNSLKIEKQGENNDRSWAVSVELVDGWCSTGHPRRTASSLSLKRRERKVYKG